MVNQKKQAQAGKYQELLQNNPNFFVIEYEKTTHKALEALRNALRKSNASMKIIKNTLFEKAVQHLSAENKDVKQVQDKVFPLKGQSAVVALSEQWSEGLKAYYDHAKKDESLKFRFGFIDANVYDDRGLETIAKLPAKEQLMAQVIGAMKSPMIKTVYAMKFNMQRLVTVMNEKAKQG